MWDLSEYLCRRRLTGHLLYADDGHAASDFLMGMAQAETAAGVARTGIRRMMIIRTTIDPGETKARATTKGRKNKSTASRDLVVGYKCENET